MNFPPSHLAETAERVSTLTGFRVVAPPRIVPAGPPDPTMHPCVRVEILDKAIANELDPLLLNDFFPFWSTLNESTTVHMNGVAVFRLVPCPPGTAATANLSRDIFEAIVADLGVDDAGETCDDWTDEGLVAARAVLVALPPGHGMPGFREERIVRLRQAESVARWYGVGAEAIARLTGRPFELRRSLLKPLGKSRALALARAKEQAQAELAATERRAQSELEQRPNSRSLGDLKLAGVAVPLLDIEVQLPRAIAARTPIWTDENGVALFVWPEIVGLPLPPGATFAGCNTLERSHVIPCVPAHRLDGVRDATVEIYDLTVRLRRKFVPDADRGPIEKWSTDGIESAKSFVRAWADILYSPTKLGQGWVAKHVVACLVRGFFLAPAMAARLLFDALEQTHARFSGKRPMVVVGRRPVGSIPFYENLRQRGSLETQRGGTFYEADENWSAPAYAGVVSLSEISRWAAEAAMGGEVEPGALLEKHDAKKKARDGL